MIALEEYEIPHGWTLTRLSEDLIVDIQPGFACGKNTRDGRGIPHLRPMNVTDKGEINLTDLKFVPESECNKSEKFVQNGDILFNNTNSPDLVGKTAYYDLQDPRAFSNHMTRLRCNIEIIDPKFCAMYIHQKWREGYFKTVCNNHVSQSSVSRNILLETPVLLPPLSEQHRIVARVEALLSQINAARDRLNRVPLIMKRFRQAVLAAACRGRLTEGWREENPDVNIGFDENVEIENPCFWDIPDNWQWTEICRICEQIVDCPHSTPKWTASGKICIRTSEIKPFYLDLSQARFVSDETFHERTQRLEPTEGDIVYSREGTLGQAAIIPKGVKICLGQRIMLLRSGSHCSPFFLMYVINSPQILKIVNELKTGSTSPHINVGDVKKLPIPLPQLAEQQEIVRRVDALFALADQIEQQVADASKRTEALTQAVLAKAFQGELVTQGDDLI